MIKLIQTLQSTSDKAVILLRNKLIDLKDWIIYAKLGLIEPDPPNTVSNFEATIYFDNKTKSYLIQSKNYPEIYTSANTLKELGKKFHDVVNYHFENSRYITKRLKFQMNFSDELKNQLEKEGLVNVSSSYKPAYS